MIREIIEKTGTDKVPTKLDEAVQFNTREDIVQALFDIEANVKGHYGKLAGDAAEALQEMK